jgi:hypothetical protein
VERQIRWEGKPNTSICVFAPEGRVRQTYISAGWVAARHLDIRHSFLKEDGRQMCSPSPDPVKIGLNGYPGYAGVVRGNAIASGPGVK